MSTEHPSPSNVTIWVWLLLLVVAGVAVLAIPISHLFAVVLIFLVAAVKAALVLRHYMHVRRQPFMIYAMLGIPVLLAIAMTLVLIPDIGLRP